ncbi:AIR synthase-related protein [Acetatifactor muris]|uniref:Hydrogenase expression/formation protein HypE n=1 Tax=Acetatifactor muris TaxID=879566 RepID=A0A2K4ZF66_9FIRM|nr:AIR synthase-related protein [Acetatifactor muris]MCR2047283.1 AIR synthase-related protein [Acetatifactor muris]SOY29088.1 Hydrogenase expression/formation protein HypE [Acetatifactor muris]
MKTGKVPENVLKRSVLRQIKTKRREVLCGAGIGVDCATFSFPGEGEIVSCVQEAALVPAGMPGCAGGFPGTFMTMAALIQKCVNNLAAGGGRTAAVLISLMMPESSEESELRMLMAEAEEKCRELSLQIAGGQTRIAEAVSLPVATVTGIGRKWEVSAVPGDARPGQDIVISKWVGLEGTAYLAGRHREKLLRRYPAWFVEEAEHFGRYLSIVTEAQVAVKQGATLMHDASEGGIFGALWELAERAGVGLTVDMRGLPLRQETVEVCECCGANPYELLSGGCLIMISSDGPGLTAALEMAGVPAVTVGKITDSNDRILLNGEEIRYLDRPKSDSMLPLFRQDTEL